MADENGSVENILKFWQEATEAEIAEGLAWYSDARQTCIRWATEYDITIKQAAHAIAALSPRTRWDENLRFAEGVIRGVGEKLLPSEIKDRYAPTFASAVAMAWAIVRYKDYDLLTGQKVRSFCDNIIDVKSTAITVDVWANRVWLNDLTSNRNITSARYAACEDDYVAAWEKVRKTSPKVKYAYQLQAIVWVVARNRAADKVRSL